MTNQLQKPPVREIYKYCNSWMLSEQGVLQPAVALEEVCQFCREFYHCMSNWHMSCTITANIPHLMMGGGIIKNYVGTFPDRERVREDWGDMGVFYWEIEEDAVYCSLTPPDSRWRRRFIIDCTLFPEKKEEFMIGLEKLLKKLNLEE